MEILKVKIEGDSILCEHNYPCPIYPDEKAVRMIGSNYFQPSWKAQKDGYKIVKVENKLQKLLIKLFKTDFKIKINGGKNGQP